MRDLPWKSIVVSTLTALVAVTLPAVLVIFDIAVFDLDCDERGVVEVAQALMLLTIFALMTVAAFRRPDLRGGLVLIAGFFLDMLIRENDGFLDRIRHGCWVYPALLAVIFLMIGTNNTGHFKFAEEPPIDTIAGVRAVVRGPEFPSPAGRDVRRHRFLPHFRDEADLESGRRSR